MYLLCVLQNPAIVKDVVGEICVRAKYRKNRRDFCEVNRKSRVIMQEYIASYRMHSVRQGLFPLPVSLHIKTIPLCL